MRGAQLFEMVEKRGQPFYLIELKLYLISKSRAKALDLREERGAGISQRRGPLGRRICIERCRGSWMDRQVDAYMDG